MDVCENLMMHLPWLNRSQRVVLVVGFGVTLYILGAWLSAPEFPVSTGWVGYAPLTSSFGRTRLGGGADLILWLVLIALWVAASSYLLRTRTSNRDQN
jgi:heme/copper-type cytochrome/quinol oxidase subunit 1